MIENCPMRHENGNCIPAGGFCTANKNICEALRNAYRMGKAHVFNYCSNRLNDVLADAYMNDETDERRTDGQKTGD